MRAGQLWHDEASSRYGLPPVQAPGPRLMLPVRLDRAGLVMLVGWDEAKEYQKWAYKEARMITGVLFVVQDVCVRCRVPAPAQRLLQARARW